MAVDSQVFTLDEFYTYVDWPYALPDFQREYIWDDAVKKLLDDIQKYMDTPKLDQHFIGSIVLQNRDTKVKISPLDIMEALEEWKVVKTMVQKLIKISQFHKYKVFETGRNERYLSNLKIVTS